MGRDTSSPQRVFGTPTILPILNALRLMADDQERDLEERAVLGRLVTWVEHAQTEHRLCILAKTRMLRLSRKYRKLIRRMS